MAPDPDRMGQSRAARARSWKKVPDPLRVEAAASLMALRGRALSSWCRRRSASDRSPTGPMPGRAVAGAGGCPDRQGRLAHHRLGQRRHARRGPHAGARHRAARRTRLPMTLQRHADPGRRDRARDHRRDGEGAGGHRRVSSSGTSSWPAWPRWTRPAPRCPTPPSRASAAPQARAQGPAHHAGRHRLPLGERRRSARNSSSSPTSARPARSSRAAGSRTWTSCWSARTSRGSTSGCEHFIADRRRPARGGRVDRDRDPGRAASGSSATPSSTRCGTAARRSRSSTRPTSSRW